LGVARVLDSGFFNEHVLHPNPVAVDRHGQRIQFGSDLFYANAGRFAADMRGLVEGAEPPVKRLLVDAGAITSIDYSALPASWC
jgi:hypothetical protein